MRCMYLLCCLMLVVSQGLHSQDVSQNPFVPAHSTSMRLPALAFRAPDSSPLVALRNKHDDAVPIADIKDRLQLLKREAKEEKSRFGSNSSRLTTLNVQIERLSKYRDGVIVVEAMLRLLPESLP